MTMNMFAYNESPMKPPYEELNTLIAHGDSKGAVKLLRTLGKTDLFEALARNRFTICGNTSHEIINHVQNRLLTQCQERAAIALVL